MKTNTVKYQAYFVLILAVAVLTGCASFSNTRVWRASKKLTENNLSELTGTYSFSPDYGYDKKGNQEDVINDKKKDYFYQYLTNKAISIDTVSRYFISLTYLKENSIAISIKKERLMIDSLILSGRLQSRGLLKVGKTEVKVHGIPYLLGGTQSKKTRIGVAKDGGLILNHAVDNSGAFLLLIGAGRGFDVAYHFKRINPKS
ncbi:hypothetical protein EZ428_23160 [Pedobacter frigiditerrae]|uniref:Uncharacterized protein n=1 Tax=Pedobacter frigiditerrae TaxID=2530452 RepID=A0A4R0MK88_9SPHI|nr:hypothetical protein [Pedobacter frigiditerrae]TCC86612.1 hypothetical protein EZ428_23160 [Pedobacter frigiditerrae]